MMNRNDTLKLLGKAPEVSVLIVGAGINGVGTFRDLALNGVDVLLIDRMDFCSGASAASSHMAHGGIRYLENGEFRLVREAVQERNRLIRSAPHLVRPLPTTIPIFHRFSGLLNAPLKFLGLLDRPAERGSLVIKLGLLLYDAYAGRDRVVPRHQFLGRRDSLAKWGSLNSSICHTATYYDGAILQPERLGLELILDAEAANSKAHAVNYMSLVQARDAKLVLRDELTGVIREIAPRLVINATGPWIDHANRVMGYPTRFIGGTKGSHLVLDHKELRAAIGDHEFFFENDDGRIVLIFPLYDRVLIGTSDILIEDPDSARCTEEEVDYFLGMLKRVFPAIEVSRSNIVFRFSGVRPLPAAGTSATGQITRDHQIRYISGSAAGLPFPIYSLVGGKWTSFRAFSEQVTDKVLAFLGRSRSADTRNLPIGGGNGYPSEVIDQKMAVANIAAKSGIAIDRVETLFERYGTRAQQVADFIGGDRDARLKTLPDYSHREFGFLARHEKVVHLDDVLLRRTMLAMLGHLSRETAVEIAELLAEWLDWNPDRTQSEVTRMREIMRDQHQVIL